MTSKPSEAGHFRTYSIAINFLLRMFIRLGYTTQGQQYSWKIFIQSRDRVVDWRPPCLSSFLELFEYLFFVFLFRPNSCSCNCVFIYALVCLEEFPHALPQLVNDSGHVINILKSLISINTSKCQQMINTMKINHIWAVLPELCC